MTRCPEILADAPARPYDNCPTRRTGMPRPIAPNDFGGGLRLDPSARDGLLAVAAEDRAAADELPAVAMVRRPAAGAGHPRPELDQDAADLAERRPGVLGRGGPGLEDIHPLRELGGHPRDQPVVDRQRLADPAADSDSNWSARFRSTCTSIRSGLIDRSIPPGGLIRSRAASDRRTSPARKYRAMSGSFAWTMKARSNSGSPQRTGRVPLGGCGVAAREAGASSNRKGRPRPNRTTTRVLGVVGCPGIGGARPTRTVAPL